MKYDQPVTEIIKSRKSVRKFAKERLPEDILDTVIRIISEENTGPWGNTCRFWLVHRHEYSDKPVKLGTYGFISGATHFIAGAINPKAQKSLEDYGYVLQKKILRLTDIGLGTCWVGGSFRRDEYAKTAHMEKEEVIATITPFGYPHDRQGIRERIIRLFTTAPKVRKSWMELFFLGDFLTILTPGLAGMYADALEAVRMAPSANNSQPWRVIRSGNTFHFFECPKGPVPGESKKVNLSRIDMGIAMCHFELALNHAGFTGRWEIRATGLLSARNMIYSGSFVLD